MESEFEIAYEDLEIIDEREEFEESCPYLNFAIIKKEYPTIQEKAKRMLTERGKVND